MSSSSFKKKNSLLVTFLCFLKGLSLSLSNCTPNDVRRFLVLKDSKGKTSVHNLRCLYLGSMTSGECQCPRREASGTVEGIIQQLIQVFDEQGFCRQWDIVLGRGNPAASPQVKQSMCYQSRLSHFSSLRLEQ